MPDYSTLHIAPIGTVHTPERYRYEAPRQGVFASNRGAIELLPGRGFEEALGDLEGFERIWVIFKFHLNQTWKPKVSPPVISPAGRKVGVFACRSPHRPNPLGLSCVRLEKIEGLTLHIANFDMLDGTPVFDLKPYVPKVDSFPTSRTGWMEAGEAPEYQITFLPPFLAGARFIREHGGLDLENFCRVQLAFNPADASRKRLFSGENGELSIACRTWRIKFEIDDRQHAVTVKSVVSGYRPGELAPDAPDPYGDKPLHRSFLASFGNSQKNRPAI